MNFMKILYRSVHSSLRANCNQLLEKEFAVDLTCSAQTTTKREKTTSNCSKEGVVNGTYRALAV